MSDILMSQLWDAVPDNESMSKVASWTGDFLRDRIRETCVANRVLPPRTLTEAELDNNTENDLPLKRIPIEPDSKAFVLGFRGKGEAKFLEGKKYEVWFNKFETEHYKKTREELMTMKHPVIDIVNSNFVFDLQEKVDAVFRLRLDAAATVGKLNVTIDDPGTGTPQKFADVFKNKCLEASQKIIGRRRRPARWIMTEATWMNMAKLENDKLGFGNLVQTIAIEGVGDLKKFLGYEVITTINSTQASSVWDDGTIYCVTAPNFLGANFTLGDINNEMKREGNMLSWYQWMDQGMEIGNVSSVARITGVNHLV